MSSILTLPYNVLIEADAIQQRIAELGAQITRDYQGKSLVVVGILKGSVIFMSDLIRAIDLNVTIDFMSISSYGSQMVSSGVVRLVYDLRNSIENKDVLLVEDIIDTGLTLRYLMENLTTRHPRSLKICALLDKKEARQANNHLKIDYTGFTVPNEFLVGYGLDYDEKYRNLPFIASIQNSNE